MNILEILSRKVVQQVRSGFWCVRFCMMKIGRPAKSNQSISPVILITTL